jgi:hypothetical protein
MEAAATHQVRLELHKGYVPERDDQGRGRLTSSGGRREKLLKKILGGCALPGESDDINTRGESLLPTSPLSAGWSRTDVHSVPEDNSSRGWGAARRGLLNLTKDFGRSLWWCLCPCR